MNNLFVRADDTVVVISGKDKGKKGKVIATYPKDNKVLVEGVNASKRHQKPRKRTDQGGIITKDCPLYASKVMRICPKCSKPTRAAHTLSKDGTKTRMCKKCGEAI
ncbi:MAG: 50S ribosomal protein L24 [Oscillospiraceae bacterium]|nr:50S ribosomal protein L24 [Oscillospiraceae bacterium]